MNIDLLTCAFYVLVHSPDNLLVQNSMAWTAEWEGEFLVGGTNKLRLTPNFRLNEFQNKNGKIRAHRELVATLQLLRDRFKASISVGETDADGLGATVTSKSMDTLLESAKVLEELNFFEAVKEESDGINVRIHRPGDRVEVDLEQALMTAFMVTARFETSGDPFKQITGNFDGAGLSFGPSQWNFGTGTLQPLFRRFIKEDEVALKASFLSDGTDDDYNEFLDVLEREKSAQIQWGNSISTGRRLADVIHPWKGYFQKVGGVERFRSIMVEESLVKYGARMLKEVQYLQSLVPGIQIDHLRAICALYDLVIQQGSLNKAHAEIEARVKKEKPKNQLHLVQIAVEERGLRANAPWRADTVSRRKGILEGIPVTVKVTDAEVSQRANINFYMLRNVHIKNAKELIDANVMEQLTKVSNAIAEGRTLTAI